MSQCVGLLSLDVHGDKFSILWGQNQNGNPSIALHNKSLSVIHDTVPKSLHLVFRVAVVSGRVVVVVQGCVRPG